MGSRVKSGREVKFPHVWAFCGRFCALGVLGMWLSSSLALAGHVADHLLISEVGYDTATEGTGSPSSEFVEIHNPTQGPILLNQGAIPGEANGMSAYFISDARNDYFKVVNGSVALNTNTDVVLQFPPGQVLQPHQTAVICSDSDAFLAEHFAGDLDLFLNQPGAPLLFESTQDGEDDQVPDMVSTGQVNGITYPLNLTNGGEVLILFYWDGQSDLIQDADIVVWKSTSEVVNKPAAASGGFDGPDEGSQVSYYLPETSQTTSVGLSIPSEGRNKVSLQRRTITESDEVGSSDDPDGDGVSGGNGLTGHDETAEHWGSDAVRHWEYASFSPGVPWVGMEDGDGGGSDSVLDALSFLSPVAVSAADGAAGETSPLDYGAEGTLTELFLASLDTDYDRVIDTFYVALRGDLFGEPDGDANATYLLFDLDPTEGTGARRLLAGGDLLDYSGSVDSELTLAGVSLATEGFNTIGFDGAVGLTSSSPASSDTAGWRTFGTGGTLGGINDFAYLGDHTRVSFSGEVPSSYPGADGTSHGAGDGFEAMIPYSELSGNSLEFIFVIAVTTAGDGLNASPNTLPESGGDDLNDLPQVMDRGICFSVATGAAIRYHQDLDLDGHGSSLESDYCGPPVDGVAASSGDCADDDPQINPGVAEVCDGVDNNCDGVVDEGVEATFYHDGDGDGAGDDQDTVTACESDGPMDYVLVGGDCDDGDPGSYPGADEVCDPLETGPRDNDCDGVIDEDLTFVTQYPDGDGDGYGGDPSLTDCRLNEGYVLAGGDCDDVSAETYPGADEACDGLDNDCDTYLPADENDVDDDGFWQCNGDCDDGSSSTYPGADELCDGEDNDCDGTLGAEESDDDADGFLACEGDCDDGSSAVYPGADELCDGLDNDCDGRIDEEVTTTFYLDLDGDGYGGADTVEACAEGAGLVANNDDCNDGDIATNPGAIEVCDDIDNDCDGLIDEEVRLPFYPDLDGDGFGSADGMAVEACTLPLGYSASSSDCNDGLDTIHPGAEEVCNRIDDDCDGTLPDAELDGDMDGQAPCEGDCDDDNLRIFTGADELCDGVDTDCDGALGSDELDQDGDGFLSCDDGVTPVDCQEGDRSIYPGAEELCNDGLDDDCNPDTDENSDDDGDGFAICAGDCAEGAAAVYPGAIDTCDGGIDNDCDPDTLETVDQDGDGEAACDGDCDDRDPEIGSEATERCNNVDDNCDGAVDEGFEVDGDGDGFGGPSCGGDDCDDTEPSIHPGAEDVPNDGIDQDCDGGDAIDADGDGYAVTGGPPPLDCNDADPSIHPEQAEDSCVDGVDNDCDALVDYEDGDCAGFDQDGDGLSYAEEQALGTDPTQADTDGDGLSDGLESAGATNPLLADTDDDGLADGVEDSNQDGVLDAGETNPASADTDGDGLSDGTEDSNQNGVVDGGESDPREADTDRDGLSDGQEVTEYGTDPASPDTDADGLLDGAEVTTYGTDPLDSDTDQGGQQDGAEVMLGTDPLDPSDDVDESATPVPTPGPGDDDGTATPENEGDTPSGDDEYTPSGDDDDDTTPDPEPVGGSGSDQSDGCTCATGPVERPLPTSMVLMGFLTLLVVGRRRRAH